MIISHKFKFIFIKTMKTAGTSIEIYLSGHCADDDILTPINPGFESHNARNHAGFYNHMPAVEVADRMPEIWPEYHTFCVERNPWDKVLSYYFMLKHSPLHGMQRDLSLDEYLSGDQFPLNYPLYTAGDGSRIIVDQVVRYEELNTGLKHVFSSLGVPFDGVLDIWAKSEWRTDRRHYRELLTPRQASRIADIFQKEIEIHGYRF